MCLQCVVESEIIIEGILPGYFLSQSTKDGDEEWPKGRYGIVKINDPEFVFPADPVKEPAEQEAFFKWMNEVVYPANDAIMMRLQPLDIYNLIQAAIKVGYSPEVDGDFAAWLVNYVAVQLEKKC